MTIAYKKFYLFETNKFMTTIKFSARFAPICTTKLPIMLLHLITKVLKIKPATARPAMHKINIPNEIALFKTAT